jgi:hypothetical protein
MGVFTTHNKHKRDLSEELKTQVFVSRSMRRYIGVLSDDDRETKVSFPFAATKKNNLAAGRASIQIL